MTESHKKSSRGALRGVVLGLAVVAFGALWLMSQLGLILLASIWLYWPSLVIAVGLCTLFERGQGLGHRIFAVGLIAFGIAAQLHTLGWIHLTWGYIWPGLLMAGGLWIVLSALFHRRRKKPGWCQTRPDLPEDVVVFGGREMRVSDRDWSGGEITTVFGACKIDLRDADIKGDQVAFETTAIFGGVELRVPDHWAVELKGSPIMGTFEDKTRVPRIGTDEPRKKLIVSGAAIFGGVEVTN